MSVVLDILRTYRAPRRVLRQRIGVAAREDRALATVMAGCVLTFIAQWPRLSREAFLNDGIALEARMAGALFGWVLVAPLVLYAVALISQGVLRLAGTDVSGYEARMALFWAFFAATPMWLLSGLASGFLGQTVVTAIMGVLAVGGILVFWASGLAEISGRRETEVG